MGWELVPVAIQQKRTEHCKAIILQLKINFKKKKISKIKKKKQLYGAPVISSVLSQVQEKQAIKPTLKEISQ